MIRIPTLTGILAALALAACSPGGGEPTAEAPTSTPGSAQSALPLPAVPTGAPETVALDTYAPLQDAASVASVDMLEGSEAKIFSTVGGDPAINGTYVYIAAYKGPAEGWAIFKVGDFDEMSVESQTATAVTLKVQQSRIDENGDVISEDKRLIVSIPTATSEAITVTPAT